MISFRAMRRLVVSLRCLIRRVAARVLAWLWLVSGITVETLVKLWFSSCWALLAYLMALASAMLAKNLVALSGLTPDSWRRREMLGWKGLHSSSSSVWLFSTLIQRTRSE